MEKLSAMVILSGWDNVQGWIYDTEIDDDGVSLDESVLHMDPSEFDWSWFVTHSEASDYGDRLVTVTYFDKDDDEKKPLRAFSIWESELIEARNHGESET